MGPSMPPVPGAGMNTPMLTPVMAPGAVPVNPMAPPMADSGKKSSLAETIILVVVCLVAATAIVFAVMFFVQYNDLKDSFDSQVKSQVAEAEKNQKDADDAICLEKQKETLQQFTGPSDYGSVSFNYPKMWSVYIKSDGTENSDFEAYFSPVSVDPVDNDNSRYALRFKIVNTLSDEVQRDYINKVNDNEMTSGMFQAQNKAVTGTLYQGTIEEGIVGQVLVVKVNDKTAILQTDSEEYRADFEKLINSLRRNS